MKKLFSLLFVSFLVIALLTTGTSLAGGKKGNTENKTPDNTGVSGAAVDSSGVHGAGKENIVAPENVQDIIKDDKDKEGLYSDATDKPAEKNKEAEPKK